MARLGYCVYVSTFEKQKEFLGALENKDTYIFTSLHIVEELNKDYIEQVESMLKWICEEGFKVIGDVSKRTLEIFEEKDIVLLAKRLGLHMIRIDYGFTDEEILEIAKSFPVAFNASTVDIGLAKQLKVISKDSFAIHNYYPRAYTGLSQNQFDHINKRLETEAIQVVGFIPNYKKSRGPIYEGLPTLESQRYLPAAISYFEMINSFTMEFILLSDLGLEPLDQKIIEYYEKTEIIAIPCQLEQSFECLYEEVFTIRIDSPECAYRLQESREFFAQVKSILPSNRIERLKGSITCDNKEYGRYSGEVQILREGLPQDNRVNVIGYVERDYLALTQYIKNGQRIKFITKNGK